MRVLAVDHFFEHDLRELQRFAPEHEIRAIPYFWIRQLAKQVFRFEHFYDFESYSDPSFDEAEAQWGEILDPILETIWARFPFDVFVLPSDVIFYLRELVRWCQRHAIPAVVVQKETSITDATMVEHSEVLRKYLPFISDQMTVNSERQRQFWVRAGANPTRITVTGQPRFDFYEGGTVVERRPGKSRVLFLSYMRDAYIPRSSPMRSWSTLHVETLSVLQKFANDGAEIVAKPHPQQDEQSLDELRHVRELVDESGGSFRIANGMEDTRLLIRDADVVVGFQSTAMYEALIAKKEVVYTHWNVPPELETQLLSFNHPDGGIRVAHSPEELDRILFSLLEREDPSVLTSRDDHAFEYQLGPIDGRCSERVWAVLESCSGTEAVLPRVDRSTGRLRKSLKFLIAGLFRVLGLKSHQHRARYIRLRNELRLQGEIPLVVWDRPASPSSSVKDAEKRVHG